MKGWKFGTLTKNLDMNYILPNWHVKHWIFEYMDDMENLLVKSIICFPLQIFSWWSCVILGWSFLHWFWCLLTLYCEWHYEIDVHSTNSNVNAKGGSKNLTHENLIEWWLQIVVKHWEHGNICQFLGVAIIWHQFFNNCFREVECQIYNMVQPSMENSIGFFPNCFWYFV